MKKIIPAGVCILFILSGLWALSEFLRTREYEPHSAVDYHLTALELTNAFASDETTAMKQYGGKIVELQGKLENLKRDGDFYQILLKGNGQQNVRGEGRIENLPSQSLKKNEIIKIKGTCSGLLMDVILNDCVIIKN